MLGKCVAKILGGFALAFSFIPQVCFGLGMGEMELKSYLNQPLRAEIPLLHTKGLSKQEIIPTLADRAAFERAGVERAFFTTQLRFEIKRNEEGQLYVQVKSRQPAREPYLNFLLQVHWPSGKLLREFTLLLDPPEFKNALPPAVIAPSAGTYRALMVQTDGDDLAVPVAAAVGLDEQHQGALLDEFFGDDTDTLVEPLPSALLDEGVREEDYLSDFEIEEDAPESLSSLNADEAYFAPEDYLDASASDTGTDIEEFAAADDASIDDYANQERPLDESGADNEAVYEQGLAGSSGWSAFEAQLQALEDAESDALALEAGIALDEYRFNAEAVGGEYNNYADQGAPSPVFEDQAEDSESEAVLAVSGISASYDIQRNDTLWKIAAEAGYAQSASLHQVMIAIQRANPDAFINDNLNLIKAGHVLSMPDQTDAERIDANQALAEFARQNQAWKARLALRREQQLASTQSTETIDGTGEAPAAAPEAIETQGRLSLVAPAASVVNDTTAATPSESSTDVDQPTSGNTAAAASAIGAQTQSEQDQKALEIEAFETQRRKNEALAAELVEVTDQFTTMNDLIQLKNDQLASLEVMLSQLEQDLQVSLEEQQLDRSVAQTTRMQDEAAKADAALLENISNDLDASAPEVEPEVTTKKSSSTESLATAPSTPSPQVAEPETVGVDADLENVVAEVEAEPFNETESFNILSLLKNPFVVGGIAGALLIVVGGAYLLYRRRASDDDEWDGQDESVLDDLEAGEEDLVEDAAETSTPVDENDDQAIVDLDPEALESVMDEMDADTADALDSESALDQADIYLAYGEFERAISTLNAAIIKSPRESKLRLKMLEVLTETKDSVTFEKHFSVLTGLGVDDHIAKAKAYQAQLGENGVPNSSHLGTSAQVAGLDQLEADQTDDPLDLDSAFEGLDDDLSETSTANNAAETADATAIEDDSFDLDFDVDELSEEAQTQDAQIQGQDSGTLAQDSAADEVSLDVTAAFEGGLEPELEQDGIDIETKKSDTESHKFDLGGESDLSSDSLEGTRDIELAEDSVASEPAINLEDDFELDFEADPTQDKTQSVPIVEADISEKEKPVNPNLDDESETSLDMGLDDGGDAELEANLESNLDSMDLDTDDNFDFGDLDGLDGDMGDEDLSLMENADEVATKLELARAYIDMGDQEGAKDILDEVMSEGLDAQQAEAKALLAKVGN